mgnify:FL=1
MNQTKLRNYAEILVKRGLNVKKGQGIYLECPAEGAAFAAMIVEEAAKARAGRVIVKLKDEAVEQALLKQGYADLSGEEMKLLEDCAKSGAAFLRIETINVGTNLELSADLLSRKAKALRNERVQYQKLSGGVQTCIADFPTKAWAEAVYPELPEEERMEKLWDDVFACTRSDQEKPIEAWDRYISNTKKRKELLNQKNFKRIRYTGPGTDLTAELHKNGKWQGGNMQLADGTIYVPNIPTEEIFHAPTCDSAEGVVAATFPLNVEGVLVKDMQLEFRGGKVIRARASEGEEVLLKLLSTDEGAARLGEVALIDQDSPIASMKKIFYSSLYDENASCHMAIGLAAGPKPSTDEKMREERLNLSSIHVDFMVGSDQLSVYGENGDGKWEPILENGRFAGEYRF